MGVIIKYQLEFHEVGLKISNDLFAGDYIIDADVTASMKRGAAAASFDMVLHDLPHSEAIKLYDQCKKTDELLQVTIKLGYFDGDFDEVMKGVATEVFSEAAGEELLTHVKGIELGTYALSETDFDEFKMPVAESSIEDAVTSLLSKSSLASEAGVTPQLSDLPAEQLKERVWRDTNLFKVLRDIASMAKAEMLVCDRKIYMGCPIKNDYEPPPFDRDYNLAEFKPYAKRITKEMTLNTLDPLQAESAKGFDFIVAGDPLMRPGQKVTAKVEDYDDVSGKEFRIHHVEHVFSTSKGYYCEGKAFIPGSGANCSQVEQAASKVDADTVAKKLDGMSRAETTARPAIDVGEVKEHDVGTHHSTLNYGQRFGTTESQPSINVEVDAVDEQLYADKPIVSPFAWHKCGLVVPVYPGMRAVVGHNLHLPDDGMVMGFLWPDNPDAEPPSAREGDWWLCLPIDFDTSSPPSDSTKAANDLITSTGKRVISVKGLKITVGGDTLSNVGERPAEGNDDEFVIEHNKAMIKIGSDGSIEMKADSSGVTLKVTAAGVEIS